MESAAWLGWTQCKSPHVFKWVLLYIARWGMCVSQATCIYDCICKPYVEPVILRRNSVGAAQLGFLASLIGEKVTGFGPLKQFGIETGIPLGQARGLSSACVLLGCACMRIE